MVLVAGDELTEAEYEAFERIKSVIVPEIPAYCLENSRHTFDDQYLLKFAQAKDFNEKASLEMLKKKFLKKILKLTINHQNEFLRKINESIILCIM